MRARRKPRRKPATPPPQPLPPTAITPGEMRIELQLEGLRSIVSAGFLTLGEASRRIESKFDSALKALDRIATAIETQTKLLTRANGHERPSAHPID